LNWLKVSCPVTKLTLAPRICVLLALVGVSQTLLADTPDALDHFERHVRPVLIEKCFACHSGDVVESGLRLDSREGLLRGGEIGVAVVPGDVGASLLLEAVEYTRHDLQMPPSGRLPSSVVQDFVRWVAEGAPYPGAIDKALSKVNPDERSVADISAQAGRDWWSFQPLLDPPVPPPSGRADSETAIDWLIRKELAPRGIKPAGSADGSTLLRRAYFDLLGIPPTSEQLARFLADESPEAFARVVDELLESPLYGQRWGRHWLDVVRYCDSRDAREKNPFYAWRYRDWVVEALNQDLPYDRFLTYQLAGDILAEEGGRFDPGKVIATGVLAIGNWGYGDSDKVKMMTDIVDDQIDLVGRGFLGITLACARCHDHKFDPFTTVDYYALAGMFFSTHVVSEPVSPGAEQPVMKIPLEPSSVALRRQALSRQQLKLARELKTIRAEYVAEVRAEAVPRTAEYLAAAAVLQARVASGEGMTPVAISAQANESGLESDVLMGWLKYLGIWRSDQRPELPGRMLEKMERLFDGGQLQGWGYVTLPWIFSNPSAVASLQPPVPAGRLAMQPSPNQPVGVGWRCPTEMEIEVDVQIQDTDPGSQDGVRWSLEVSQNGLRKELRHGICHDGRSDQAHLPSRPGQKRWLRLGRGDWLALVLDVITDYRGDVCLVELNIRQVGGEGRVWNLVQDVAPDIQAGNPHADAYGQPTWSFFAMRKHQGGGDVLPWLLPDSALARWYAAVADPERKEELERLNQRLGGMLAGSVAPQVEPSDALFIYDSETPERALWAQVEPTHWGPERQQQVTKVQGRLAGIKRESGRLPPVEYALGAQEGGVPKTPHAGIQDARVHKRGHYNRLGEVAPRNIPAVLQEHEALGPLDGSGRLQLVRWITSAKNPLTARVMVNRIWQYHFGRGLVETPNNFGYLGVPPRHPGLLDHLASRFIESGWSIKQMHRQMMNTLTYQQSSQTDADSIARDPDNLWLGRASRRRLEAEAIRDALLAVTGKLDVVAGGPAMQDISSPRRTLYLATVRSDISSFPHLFDAADSSSIVGKRNESTVAPMSLFMMNHPFVRQQAESLAERVLSDKKSEASQKVRFAYETVYARPPRPEEMELGLSVMGEGRFDAVADYCHVLLIANEFIYVD